MTTRTISNWLNVAAFKARVVELRGEFISAAAGKLASSMTAAAVVLEELLASTDPNVRCRAATQLLSQGVKIAEVADLQHRVEHLEAQFAHGEGKNL